MRPYRLGIVGVGDISHAYIDNLKLYPDIVTLAGCATRHYENAKKKAEEYGIEKAYETAEEMIKDPAIDVILNITIPEFHAFYNKMALENGKHVYCEKPLATTFAEGKELVALAKEKNLLLGCAPDTFLGSRVQKMRELVEAGTIGDITAASAFITCRGHETFKEDPDFYYRKGAGPVMDIGPYYYRALSALLGPVKYCMAMTKKTWPERELLIGRRKGQKIPVEVDTHATVLLEYQCGAIATLILSFDTVETMLPRLELYGTKGTLSMPDPDPYDGPNLFGGEILLRTMENTRWFSLPRPEEETSRQAIVIENDRPFTSTTHAYNSRGIGLIDLLMALEENRPVRAGGEMALHELELMEKIYESAKTGFRQNFETTFEIPPVLREGELVP